MKGLRKSFRGKTTSAFTGRELRKCFHRSRIEEMQHDDLVTDLMDQNAELQAKVESLRVYKPK